MATMRSMFYNISSTKRNNILDNSLKHKLKDASLAGYYDTEEECEFDKYPYYDLTSSRIYHKMAILIPGMFGIIVNVFVIVLAVKYTGRKNLHHLIVNMAFSDTVVIIVSSVYEGGLSYLSFKVATFLEFVIFVALGVSSVTLFIISLERFKVTWFLTRRQGRYSLKRCLAVIAVTWLISIGISLFRITFDPYEENDIKTYLIIVYLASVVLLFLLVLIFSSLTLCSLSRLENFGNHLNNLARQARLRKIHSTVRMVQLNLLLYSICFVPFICLNTANVLEFLKVIGNIDEAICIDWQTLRFIVAPFLPVINCSFSPCIHLFCLPQLREAAKNILCRNCQPPEQDQDQIAG